MRSAAVSGSNVTCACAHACVLERLRGSRSAQCGQPWLHTRQTIHAAHASANRKQESVDWVRPGHACMRAHARAQGFEKLSKMCGQPWLHTRPTNHASSAPFTRAHAGFSAIMQSAHHP
eukprot:1421-Chlamydomonas_euryale.AAC.3